jgi:hypothetical protein
MLDSQKTLHDYSRSLGYEVLSGGEIDDSSLQDYAVYRCLSCRKIRKYSLQDIEFHIRRSIAKMALNNRMIDNKRYISDIDTDSEMFYCGKCVGVFSESKDGYCLRSVADKCRIYNGLMT